MIKNHIDIILYITFLLFNLIVGLRASRGVKTLREFSIGNKDFSTGTITSTIVATLIGGGSMFYGLQNIYINGLFFIIPLLGTSLNLILTGHVLAVRMGEFLNNLSIAEAMGNLYGTIVRRITAISGILVAMGTLAIQFQVIAKILTLLFGFQGPWVTITAATIVILYSAFGGIRSVIITDILQFIVFSIFIPILALVVWNHLKNPTQVINTITTNPIFSFKQTIGLNTRFIDSLGLLIYVIIPGMTPDIFQRVIMAKNLSQVKNSFTYASGLVFLIILSIIWLAVLLLSDKPNLEPSGLINYIITRYAYVGLKALIAIGITAMAMSTADSALNASTVLAVNDIIKFYKPSWQNSVIVTRIFSLILGIFALLLALHITDLLQLLLTTGSFYMPIVTVPFLLAIFGFRSTTRAVLIGMIAGATTVACWDKLLGHTGIRNLVPSMLANLIFLMGSHYLLRERGGWVGIQVFGPVIAARQERKEAWQHFISNIKNTKLYDYLEKNLPVREVVYCAFAIYVMGATYASFYTIPDHIVAKYAILYKIIYHSVLVCMAGFLTYPAWPPTVKSRKFITFAWPFGIFYILFVVGILLVIMSGFHEVQVMIFMINLLIAAFCVSLPLMLILSSLGILIGYLVFKIYYGPIYFTGGAESTQFKAIYLVLLFGGLLIVLFRFKKEKQVLEDKNTYLITLYEERNNELAEILDYREQVLKELNADEKALFDNTTAAYLQQVIYRMTDYLRLEVTNINLDKFLLEVKEIIKLTEFDLIPKITTKKNTKEEEINGDVTKLKQLLVNGILYVHKHNPSNRPITVVIEDAQLGHKVEHIKNYTRRLAALKFTITTEKLTSTKNDIYMIDQLPLMGQHIRKGKLIENARIIHAHYGYAELDKEHTQVYVLPVNVREIRGKVMELLRAPTVADPEELKHPLAIQLEKELLDKIKNEKLDTRLINKALDTIKKYHAGVKRKSGEPFFTHPIQVALILLGYCKDQDAVVAALLHDTVEDTSLSLIQIKNMFGEQVAFIVKKVTNLEDKLRRVSLDEHENLHRLINYEDKRAAFVKIADRLHNMRTISGHSSLAKQKNIAGETLSFFVPLAKSFELKDIATELEELSLGVLSKKK